MTVKIVTHFSTLMHYAYELGQARLSGDPERIRVAQENHDNYRDMCLMADEMIIESRLDLDNKVR